MGMIHITMKGSFYNTGERSFSAEEGGHATGIQRAIAYLNGELLSAIKLDHSLHDTGDRPPKADFGRSVE